MANHPLLIVTCHYVRDPDAVRYPGIHPIAPDDLDAHLRTARERLDIVTPDQAEAFLTGEAGLDGPSVLFTFDDGLRDHWHAAETVLAAHDVKAAFFVATRPHVEDRALLVNKLQFVRSITPPERFRVRFMEEVPAEAKLLADNAAFREKARAVYVHDDPETACVKYLANFSLDHAETESIVDGLLGDHDIGETELCERLYMDPGELRALEAEGHLVGCHGDVHKPLGTMHPDDALRDVARNRAVLSRLLEGEPRWISYPYGRGDAVPDDCARLCDALDLRAGLTLTRAWNEPGQDPHTACRVTENQFLSMLDRHDEQRRAAA